MREQFIRTEMLLGEEILKIISKQKVLLFGVGGVGGYIFESLVRSGIENIDIVDGDIIAESNINRQIIATHEKIGRKKVEVAKERIKQINNECVVNIYDKFILFAGAGATVPITNFGNLLVSGALQGYYSEGFIGLLKGLLVNASAGLSATIIISFIVAVLFKARN